ncbi:MAG TPA: hypothetical protein VF762_22960, partial [Blastocatellia bacterium]
VALGAALAVVSELTVDGALAMILILSLGVAPIVTLWLVYLLILWVFKRESRNAIEISADGIRDMRDSRERAFIPWAGIKEIELAATVAAGASLRVKGAFSEITISNMDMVVTRPMSIREMHRAAGKTKEMGDLFAALKSAAPHAALKMNKLARRRLSKFGWAGNGSATQ